MRSFLEFEGLTMKLVTAQYWRPKWKHFLRHSNYIVYGRHKGTVEHFSLKLQLRFFYEAWLLEGTYNSDAVFLWPEQIAGFAVQHDFSGGFRILDGADKKLVLAQEVRENDTEDDSCEATADEAFPSLLRTQLDERRFSEEESEHVGHDVVANNHHHGDNEPNHT